MICPVPRSRFRRTDIHRARVPTAGFTMVETLVALAVIGMFFASIALILQQVLDNIGQSRVRAIALSLAQEKMEVIRNLPYTNVGTIGGIPQGPIAQTENVTINSLEFTVTTSVVYIDDPFDGLAPADLINTDYKRARVDVSWGGTFRSRVPVAFVTNVAPKGIEMIEGGGTLFLQVFDSNALPVPNATITIDNTAVIPEIHTSTLTNANGLVVLPGAPACIVCYVVSVTRGGYSTDRTYSNSEVANPLHPHLTVLEGELTQSSFAIDRYASVTINSYGSRESGYPPVANVQFTILGTKIIGTDTSDNPVIKYSYTTNTGGGTVTIPGLEWDTYSLDFSNSAHALAGSNPPNPLAVSAGANFTVPIVAVPKTNTSLLLIVKDASGELKASASANLFNGSLGADLTKDTAATGAADFGQAFFGALTPAVYDLKITLPGYTEATASLTLSGNKQETVTLNAF